MSSRSFFPANTSSVWSDTFKKIFCSLWFLFYLSWLIDLGPGGTVESSVLTPKKGNTSQVMVASGDGAGESSCLLGLPVAYAVFYGGQY